MLHGSWRNQVYNLYHFGKSVGPRGQGTHEELDQNLVVGDSRYNLLDVPARKLNFRFAVCEWVWMMFGRADVATLAHYNSQMKQFSDDGLFLTGAYGPHIKAQYPRVLEKLRADPASRQGVIEIPRPRTATKDEPCTLSFQFLLRKAPPKGELALHLIATMRSSDVWLGVPYDVYTFTQIQNAMAGELGVKRGWFSLRAGSSHLYDRDRELALGVLHYDMTHQTLRSPDMPGFPPHWLERVLEHRSEKDIDPNGPLLWRDYAMVLLSRTSDDAREKLLEMHAGATRYPPTCRTSSGEANAR